MPHARPIPGPGALHSLSSRAHPQRTCTPVSGSGAPNVLAIILLQCITLIVSLSCTEAQLPECDALLAFIGGVNFSLAPAIAAPLRLSLRKLLLSLPAPTDWRTSKSSPRHGKRRRHAQCPATLARRAKPGRTPARPRPANPKRPNPNAATQTPRAPPARNPGPSPGPTHAYIVP